MMIYYFYYFSGCNGVILHLLLGPEHANYICCLHLFTMSKCSPRIT